MTASASERTDTELGVWYCVEHRRPRTSRWKRFTLVFATQDEARKWADRIEPPAQPLGTEYRILRVTAEIVECIVTADASERTDSDAAMDREFEAALTARDAVFSRPECPFRYCDQKGGGVCKERARCHHRPSNERAS